MNPLNFRGPVAQADEVTGVIPDKSEEALLSRGVSLKRKVWRRVQEIADATDWSVSQVVSYLVDAGLEEHDRKMASQGPGISGEVAGKLQHKVAGKR